MDRREALRRLGITANAAWMASMTGSGRAQQPQSIAARPIPSSGETIPIIGLGTWQTFDVGSDAAARQPLEQVLEVFSAAGGRVIDSSPMYGSSEQVVGDLRTRTGAPPKPFIATKVWTTGKDAGIRQMEDSMRKLRVKVMDLMQVHNLLDVDTHLATLDAWKKEGRVRYVGVTHYTAGGAEEVARLVAKRPVDFVQINYSVAERDAERRLLPLCKDKGIAVIANRPFAGGELFRQLRSRPLPAWAGEVECASWAQLMLKFVVSHPALTCAIPASAKPEHTRDNMAAGLGRMPDPAQRERIASAVLSA
jgi:diketogulonate reductase-like aldo/keto reductase